MALHSPLLTLFILLPLCLSAAPCPRSCTCPQVTELHCTFRSLLSVPEHISPHVQRINLGFNSISSVSQKSFSGLSRLELLLVHGNNIQAIPDGAFRDLSALQMLKLSYNKLRELNRYTFLGLWSLARLHLDHNHLETLDPDLFHGLTSLRLLQLEGNQIKQIHVSTFCTVTIMDHFHLSTIKHLYLSNNSLSTLSRETLETMPQLENLYLHANPLVCDCSMAWLQQWMQKAPDVLKCKKERSLPGGQLCPVCSSPRKLHQKPLQLLDDMSCSRPVITSSDHRSQPEETHQDLDQFLDDFKQPFGNISLELSDEHGNKVELECSIDEPRDVGKISFEPMGADKMASNITLMLDLDCNVDREKYERLWRLIAYYTSVPAHLKRGILLSKEPYLTYLYKQDMDKDALYYTGVKANIMAQPSWLMQSYADLQLNRQGSSGKKVKLSFMTQLSQTLETEIIQRQARMWVTIDKTNSKHKTVILGKSFDLQCHVQSSGEPIITWILPDGTKLVAPSQHSDQRLTISPDGKLEIKMAEHKDAGKYYCVSKVDGDVAFLPVFVSVQDLSKPQHGKDQTPVEIMAGNSLNLDCDAFGSPDPEVNWILPNGNIVSFTSNTSRVFVSSNGSLRIVNSLPLDNGFYKCVALNRFGSDTKFAEVVVNKRPGIVRSLRRFPLRPQSASGVNTKVKVDDLEEGSGDIEDIVVSNPIRKTLPVRNGLNLPRSPWRRPPIMLRKPNLPENGRNILDSRRRMNMAKTKINPERWADILSKIRIKNGMFGTTAAPLIVTTPKMTTQFQEATTFQQYLTTSASDSIEGSSNGATLHEKESTTPIFKQENSNSLHTTTLKPLTSPSIINFHPTTSSNVFFLPQTTSAPLQAVTIWQQRPNTPSKSITYSNHEDDRTKGVKAADPKRHKVKGNRNKKRISKLNKRVKPGQQLPTVDPVTSNRGDEIIQHVGPLKIEKIIDLVSPTAAHIWSKQSHQPNSKRHDEKRKKKPNRRKNKLRHKAVDENEELKLDISADLETDSPLVRDTQTIFAENDLRQDLDPTDFPETRLDPIPSKSQQKFTSHPLPPVKPLFQTPMKNAVLESPSEEPRHANRKLIQSRHRYTTPEGEEHLANGTWELLASRSSSPASPTEHKVEEIRHFQDTSSLMATTGIDFEVQAVTKTPEASPKTIIQENRPDKVEDLSLSVATTVLPTTTANYVTVNRATTESKLQQSSRGASSISSSTEKPYRQSESEVFSNIAPPKTTLPTNLSAYTNNRATNISKTLETSNKELQYEREMLSQNASKQAASIPVFVNDTQSQENLTNSTQTVYPRTTAMTFSSASANINIAKPIITSSLLNLTKQDPRFTFIPSTTEEHQANSSKNYIPKTTMVPSKVNFNRQKVPSIAVDKQDQNIPAKSTNSSHISVQNPALSRSLAQNPLQQDIHKSFSPNLDQSNHAKLLKTSMTPLMNATQQLTQATVEFSGPVTQSSGHKIDQFISSNLSIPKIIPRTTPAPDSTPFWAKLRTETPRASTTSKLPASATYPRGKPRITKSNFQIMSVKAETDAALPCSASGEPRPFLSWTKVSTGASIPQNTRLQRFEVHMNGTLTIRNIQPLDGGEYLCTVQNQFGSDQMLTNVVVLSQHPKILQPRHRDLSVNMGSSIDVSCQVEGHPKPKVTWVLPNQAQITTTPFSQVANRVSILQNGTLRIRQATFSDRGIYKCVGSSSSGADTVSIRLYVLSLPPVFIQMPIENVTVVENGVAYLHCTANGSPQPTIRWTTPFNIQLTSSQYLNNGNIMVFPNGTLVLRSLTQENSGKYLCLASNAIGTSKRTVNLFVRSKMLMAKASITAASAKVTEVVYGAELGLDCVAKGDPEPRVIWRTPSKKLVDAQYSFDSRIRVFSNGSLLLRPVTDKDGGEYLCIARNKMGDDHVAVTVKILTKPAKIEQKSPRWKQEVVYGGDLKVDCVASGLPDPDIRWSLPDGTMVNTREQKTGRGRRFVVFDNGTLFFNDVGKREEGDYTCYAENRVGKDQMKVHVKVTSAASAPRILDKAHNLPVEVTYGENLTLHCDARGEPKPTQTWISPMNRVIATNTEKYQVLNDGMLIVRKVQRFDAGDYTCVARNAIGQDNKVVKVAVLVHPPVFSAQGNHFKAATHENERVLLDCAAKGSPNPRVVWVLPGSVILPAPYSSNRITVFPNGTLEIRSARKSDSGELACVARNEGGEVRLAVSLDVKEATAGMQVLENKTETVWLSAGNALILNCTFAGNNVQPITWMLPNGAPLLSGARVSKFFHHPDGSLIISNPSLAEAGTYRCAGRSNSAKFEQFVELAPGRKPEILNRYNAAVNVLNGEMLMLNCVTDAHALRLTWTLPSGVILNRPQKAGRYSVLPNGTLAIQQISVYDRGLYVCRAANEYGSSFLSVSVIVIAYPPRITNGPSSVTYAKRGVAVQLNCAVTGIPSAEVAWETPDKARLVVGSVPRLLGNKYLHPQGALVIQNPSQRDAGVYKCTARNAVGMDSRTTYLNVF